MRAWPCKYRTRSPRLTRNDAPPWRSAENPSDELRRHLPETNSSPLFAKTSRGCNIGPTLREVEVAYEEARSARCRNGRMCACTSTPGPMVEAGYPAGSIALAAIERGDWATAERLLTDDGGSPRTIPRGWSISAASTWRPDGRTSPRRLARALFIAGRSRDARRPDDHDRSARPRAIAFYATVQTAARQGRHLQADRRSRVARR